MLFCRTMRGLWPPPSCLRTELKYTLCGIVDNWLTMLMSVWGNTCRTTAEREAGQRAVSTNWLHCWNKVPISLLNARQQLKLYGGRRRRVWRCKLTALATYIWHTCGIVGHQQTQQLVVVNNFCTWMLCVAVAVAVAVGMPYA